MRPPRINSASAIANPKLKCPMCGAKYYIYACPQFMSQSPNQRRDLIKRWNRCFNCLSQSHAASNCKSKYTCRVCQNKHHTLLHVASDSPAAMEITGARSIATVSTDKSQGVLASHVASARTHARPRVLLATAWIRVRVPSGREVIVRALMDQGSEMTFIIESLAQTLRVLRIRMPIAVSAVGSVNARTCRHAARITVSSRSTSTPAFSTTALILKTLTKYKPRSSQVDSPFDHLADLPWADSDPLSADPIHIIIGADLYSEMLLDGVRKGPSGQPIAQQTVLGWILSGPMADPPLSTRISRSTTVTKCAMDNINTHHCLSLSGLEQELRAFWDLEEVPRASPLYPPKLQCERHFQATHSRDASGRYTVRLPFKEGPPIGDSLSRADCLLRSLHRRFRQYPALKEEYSKFLKEYENCGHMGAIPDKQEISAQCVYIPHHPVLRQTSATTPVRVVFNASSPTTNGSSLNDHLLTGPKLQADLASVVLRWRLYRYVYSADIKQMYRQIRVDPRDADYQRILWNAEFSAPPRAYRLLTVTYGTASAPYLALRVLQQLVQDEGESYPLAVDILRSYVYVDDVLFGDDDLQRLNQRRIQIQQLLSRGGFELRKWASNSAQLISAIETNQRGQADSKLLQTDDRIKILGISWSSSSDTFLFQILLPDDVPRTKRSILSTIARLFDPLGWVTPVTVTAKIFMQRLWKLRLEWDDEIPSDFFQHWTAVYRGLDTLSGLRIPRWMGHGIHAERMELHGFCDASSVAYAAVVYMQTVSRDKVRVTLIASRSRVAPIFAVSIPRLELSAALLLARLLDFVRTTLNLNIHRCLCWTDSTVVLAWLGRHSSRWKPFVANRVAEVQSLLSSVPWRHVPTATNPADCASRGILGGDLRSHPLWWHGPDWLSLGDELWPSQSALPVPESDPEMECRVITVHQCTTREPWELAS